MELRNHTAVLIMGLALVLVFALPALSEEKPDDDMQARIEKLRVDKKRFFEEKMKLTESEAKVFWPIYESYTDENFKLGEHLIERIREYADKYDHLSDEDLKKMRKDYIALHLETWRLIESYLPKFEAVLPQRVVSRWFQLERSVESEFEAMLGRLIPVVR